MQSIGFEYVLLKFQVPTENEPYEVINGNIRQIIIKDNVSYYYVEAYAPAYTTTNVTIAPITYINTNPTETDLSNQSKIIAYSNPFNETITFNYYLENSSDIKLEIYNSLGQYITNLIDDFKIAGNYTISWNVNNLSSGIYIYRFRTANSLISGKCLLLK